MAARTAAAAAVAAAAGTAVAVASTLGPVSSAEPKRSYVNPVSRGFADTFPDPSVIRGRDGYWYAYGTSDPLREGQTRRVLLPIARSRDLVTWTFVGMVFGTANHPRWATRSSSFWAPDIRYFAGSYHLYYVATDTTFTADPFDRAIGVATAPTPIGPWTDSGAPVVGPRAERPGAGRCGRWTRLSSPTSKAPVTCTTARTRAGCG